jgi:phosphoribosylglycinamide formyltransferase 2
MAIRSKMLLEFEVVRITAVPSAKEVNFAMDRKAIRDVATQKLGIKTANYK